MQYGEKTLRRLGYLIGLICKRLALFLLLWHSEALAQIPGPTIVDFRRDGDSLVVDVTFEPPPGADWGSERFFDDPANIARLTDGMVSFASSFANSSVQDLHTTETGSRVEVVFTLSVEVPLGAKAVTFRWPQAFGAVVLRQHAVSEPFGGYFAPGQFPGAIPLNGGASRSSHDIAVENFFVGFETVWPRGTELIFLAVLIFLKRGRLGPMIAQLAALGFGHACGSIALFFVSWTPEATLMFWALPVVIVILACDNIFMRSLSIWRLALLLCFAAMQSFGFAATIDPVNLATEQVLSATAGHGLGILAGISAGVVVGYLTLAFWFGHSLKYRGRVIMPASVTILGWELYRLFG